MHKGKTIIITEDVANAIRDNVNMTEYKFNCNVKSFLHDLLIDPANAKTSDLLRMYGFDRKRLLYHLMKCGLVIKNERICDKDSDGNPKTATMKVKYCVPKKNFNRKLNRLFIKLFEQNCTEEECRMDEDGEFGMMGGCAGQYDAPLFGVQKRKFNEDTCLCNVGDYQYDTPFPCDDESMSRGDGENGSTSVVIAGNPTK